jgi:ABC-type bacteriocin/lantibiotic exporter with double-glycine peptidase domain
MNRFVWFYCHLSLAGMALPAERATVPVSAEVADAEKPLCGAYCLYVGLLALEIPVGDLDQVQDRLGPPPKPGYSFAQLAKAAESFGAHTLGVQTTLEQLDARPQRFVCIGHLRSNHFVIIANISPDLVTYCDPPAEGSMPQLTFNALWDGQALLLAREPLIPEEEIVVRSARSAFVWWLLGAGILGIGGYILLRRRAA